MTLRSFRSVIDLSLPFGHPSSEQLERINSRLRSPLKESDIFVFPSVASNRNEDSYFSIMDDSSLRNYAKDYNEGLALLNGHNDRAIIPSGRTFEGRFDESNGNVQVWSYITRNINLEGNVNTNDVIRSIETGTIQDGSIRFNGGWDRCEVCMERLFSRKCDHMPGHEYEIDGRGLVKATYRIIDARAKEYSLVNIGATPEAGVIRKAHDLRRRNLLTVKDLNKLSRTFHFNLRTAIEGEEYLKFSFESELSDDDGDDAENIDIDPTTGKPKDDKDLPVNEVSTDGDMDGRTMTEKEIAIRYWKNILVRDGASLTPESLQSIQDYVSALERGEDKEEMPKIEKSSAKEKDGEEDEEHKHDQPGNKKGSVGDKGTKSDDQGEVRYFKPSRAFTISELLRASVIPVGADSGVPEPGEMDMAGLVMPGQEPLQNVPYKVWEETDGPATPGEGDQISQDTSLEIPMLKIEPSGIIKFLMNGKESVMGGVGLGGMVPMSSSVKGDFTGEVRATPITIRLDNEENIRALVSMGQDGAFYRQRLCRDLVRYGCLVHGNVFDTAFHLRTAAKLSTEDLAKYVDSYARQVDQKFKAGDIEHLEPSEFLMATQRRQTVGSNNSNGKGPTRVPAYAGASDPLDRADLYNDRAS